MRRWGKRRQSTDLLAAPGPAGPADPADPADPIEPAGYGDLDAERALFGDFFGDWLRGQVLDPSARLAYETAYRLHVFPAFARRRVRVIRPFQVQAWLADLSERFGPSTVSTAFLIAAGVLDLAVAKAAIEKNPARSVAVRMPAYRERGIQVWDDADVAAVIGAHPDELRLTPELAASCGLREAELYGLAIEDFDFEEKIVRVRRQVKQARADRRVFIFALPEHDRERIVPLPDYSAREVRRHIEQNPPRPCTLPWQRPDGEPHTCSLLLRWPADGQHIRPRDYAAKVWKPALAKAGIVARADGDVRLDQLRHYYASVLLAGGVSIGELADYLGADPPATLSAYAHLLPSAHDRVRAVLGARFPP
jgi:integrase